MAETGAVLGIETSCDETAAAVVLEGRKVLSSVVASQVDLHARYGGVVPELASRAHLELLQPVISEALSKAGINEAAAGAELSAVAATAGPGLIGALLTGISAAKALSLGWDVPFVGVNHLEGHLYAAILDSPDMELPVVVLLASGGHTLLLVMQGPGRYAHLGETLDDAAGEAFDKVARLLGLGYPGGPAVEAAAREGDREAIRFPRPLEAVGYDFSFSGLKTAVSVYLRKNPGARAVDVAASFQQAVVDVLVHKATAAVVSTGARGICLAGGVAANTSLREAVSAAARAMGVGCYLPDRAMCTDNAAMIAAAGWDRLRSDGPSPLSMAAVPGWRLPGARG
ncbi:MAG: tRNA (adenosine(37)-N6)-threonylcarbamoyltransferase complex transferase subunit TsaD [Acidimicrobiales bacterium]